MKLKFCTALLTAATILAPLSAMAKNVQDPAAAKRAAMAAFGKLPLSFEPTQSVARFVAHSGNYTVSVGARESSIAVSAAGKSQSLAFAFENANQGATLEALEQQVGVSNYYLGQDPSQWRLGVKHYAKLREQGVYPGVDVVYYGDSRRLEFDFVVAPKADPGVIALSFSGMQGFYKDASGDLVAELNGKTVRFGKPYAYQKVAGVSKPVEVDYEVAAAGSVHLHLGDYDKSSELIIDPVVSYVTYLGGAEGDTANGIAVDTTGPLPGVFVTGQTCSNNFPEGTPPSPNPTGYTLVGNCNAYVTKYSLDGSGSTPAYASATGNGVAVDASDQAYVAGTTNISDLPGSIDAASNLLTSPHGYQGGDSDAFITILKADGTLLRMTYLGGSYADSANAIALDHATPPNVIVVGQTQSYDFPGYNAFEAQIEAYVAFVTKLDNNLDIASPKLAPGSPGYINPILSVFAPAPPNVGTAKFFFSEFYGGQIMTIGPGATTKWNQFTQYPAGVIVYDNLQPAHSQLALNSGCSGPYVPPPTIPPNVPLPAWNPTLFGRTTDQDTVNVPPCGAAITWEDLGVIGIPIYHTTVAYGVAVDPPGDVFVVGGTDTPTLEPWSHYVGTGAWVLKVSGIDGSDIYSTALETTPSPNGTTDVARAVAVDSQGRAYVTGTVTGTLLYPTGYQSTVAGGTDAFLLRMNTSGSNIDYATYLGGEGNDQGLGVAVDAAGDAYVTGSTQSTTLPTVNPLVSPSTYNLLTTRSGTMDAFISEISADGSTLLFSSYLGGNNIDQANAIAVDQSTGDMYLAGNTFSTDFESLNPAGYTAPQIQNGGGGDGFVTKIAASGAGIAGLATISLSPSPLDFSNQVVNSTTTLPLTLTNSSPSAVLTISQVLFSGSSTFTMDDSACPPPTILAAGATCIIKVTFVPTSAASESATISVSGSATNSPTVNITGTGTSHTTTTGSGGSSGPFTVTPMTKGLAINPGATAAYPLSVAPLSGFVGSINFTCAGPSGSSCSVDVNPLTMDGPTTKTVTLSVKTTGGSGAMAKSRLAGRSIFLSLLPFSIMGMLLINKRRGGWLALLLVALSLLLGSMSCGASSSSSSGALAPGAYQVTVTATTANATPQTLTLGLQVNSQ
jgi:hypothetical protein